MRPEEENSVHFANLREAWNKKVILFVINVVRKTTSVVSTRILGPINF